MCGRYAFHSIKELQDRFGTENVLVDLEPHYNIAPGSYDPTITRNSPNKIELMKWGLIPFWAKDPKIGYKMINARSETVSSAPSFREPFKSKRCLIPADGFYEWKHVSEKEKVPYFIKKKDNKIFSFAGLFDIWKDAEGKEIKSFTIITTTPNDLIKPIHNRMPVILREEDEDVWLSKETSVIDLIKLLRPIDAVLLEAYQVSTKVNSPRNDSPELADML